MAQATAAAQPKGATPSPPIPPVSPNRAEFAFTRSPYFVRGGEDPVVRLPLAQHAPLTIEFPASDNFHAINPGGSYLVTVDNQVDLKTDHALTFRAGSWFAPAEDGKPVKPVASITVQMNSGAFITLMFYPVRYVDEAYSRFVINYSREEVVAARRAAGLAVNLNMPQTSQAEPATASIRATHPTPAGQADARQVTGRELNGGSADGAAVAPRSARYLLMRGGERVHRANRSGAAGVDFVAEARRALARAVEQPGKFREWSETVNGLRISALPAVEFDPQRRLSVIAVRNVTTAPLRLLPDQPAIDLEMIGDGGQVMQLRTVNKIFTDTTSLAGALPAGATIYYAVVYEPPVLDRRQRLRLTFAHSEAADEAVTSAITTTSARPGK